MSDELNKKASNNECMIINLDESKNEGTHWVSLFIKDITSYYFNSYGFPPTKEVQKYCTEPKFYNSFQIQKVNEVICGHYCIYILYKLDIG